MSTVTERLIRQADLVPESILSTPITVIGAGAIGSFTVLTLAKMGFSDILVYDADTVEEHNIPNQFYPLSAVGTHKVDALKDMIQTFEGIDILTVREHWRPNSIFEQQNSPLMDSLVISAVDSMRVRKSLFNTIRDNQNELGVKGFIDGRMGKNQLEVYTVNVQNKGDRSSYNASLVTDEEAEQLRCTEKAVMYNVLTVSSWIANQTRLLLTGKPYYQTIIFDLETMVLVTPKNR